MTHAAGVEAIPSELLVELDRLRKLEERLKSEHRQLRSDAETEIARLHAALRETADRVKEREREIERLSAALEERARVVAEAESRHRDAQANLRAELERRTADLEGRLHAEAVRQKDDQLARTAVAPPALHAARSLSSPSKRERELARREEELTRREVELALLRRRIGEAELRLAERAWRAGALPSAGVGEAEQAAPTFADGLRGMALRKRLVTSDGGS